MNFIKDQYRGRKIIKTNRKLVGDVSADSKTIALILSEVLPEHQKNAIVEDKLFDIYFNKPDYWEKTKEQRSDINNKITVDDAWAISRTINFYCFGEPIKYVSRSTDEQSGKQAQVELLSEFLDYQHNHDATTMATLSGSVCGLGYKLALPSSKEEFDFSGIPFVINSEFIFPQKAFCVYNNNVIGDKVLGVIIGDHYNDKNEKDGEQYNVWTKTHQYLFVQNDRNEYVPQPFIVNNEEYTGYPTFINRVPLVEVERNAFRKGDWEMCLDLFELKNKLASNRADDIQQVVDYVLVLINCKFETEEDKQNAIKNRLFELEQKDPQNKPEIQVLKNALEQGGVQVYADYIDNLIETTAGIPSRAERSGGGHDTGAAVIYRNGFRDLENNAGMIIPKMDKAETEFVGVCIAYSHNLTDGKDKLNLLQPYDIRNKFVRSLSDDPLTASNSYATFRGAGMNDLDALIASRAVTDPAEVHKNNVEAQKIEQKEQQNQDVKKNLDTE